MNKYKFSDLFQKWGLNSIKLNVRFAELEFTPTEDDQVASWEMYVELITRITTQPLAENTGDEETALASIYSLFGITREILKFKGRKAENFTKIAIIILNQVVRPFTAKWHKKKLEKAFENKTECDNFRKELEVLQSDLVNYSKILADLAMVEDMTVLTP